MTGGGPSLEERVRARLARLRADGLLRTPRPPAGADFSSNDYLNLSSHPRVIAALIDGVEREGAGSTGSRLLRGERDAFVAVEKDFARFKRTERALYFSSGYLANLGVLATLPEASDLIFSDERNHASLIDACRLSRARCVVWPHNDIQALDRQLSETPCSGVRFVVVESVYSMDGDFAPLEACARLCRARHAVLIVDEAHAVGVHGSRGSGLLETIASADEVISVNTAGKALGVAGAFVAGPEWAIEYVLQRARPFVFSTAAPPALAYALRASLTVIKEEPERRHRLHARALQLRRSLQTAGIDIPAGSSQIVPIVIGDNERTVAVADALQSAGFDVRAIRPPTVPAGTARLRVSVKADVSPATVDALVDCLKECLDAAEVPLSAQRVGDQR